MLECTQCQWTGTISESLEQSDDDRYMYMCPVCTWIETDYSPLNHKTMNNLEKICRAIYLEFATGENDEHCLAKIENIKPIIKLALETESLDLSIKSVRDVTNAHNAIINDVFKTLKP
jgi:hypothetical protein